MLEYLHHATKSEGGEFACVGTFMPRWVQHLKEDRILTAYELRALKRFMRVVAVGSRLVMREYARIREVAEGDARPLRQLSIAQFVEGSTTMSDTRKTREPKRPTLVAGPPVTIWAGGDEAECKKLRWGLPVNALNMGAIPFTPRWAPVAMAPRSITVAPSLSAPPL